MVLSFAQHLGSTGTNAQDAITFQTNWDPANQALLKTGLTNITATAGIPSMLNFMGSFDITGSPSAVTAVISEAGVFSTVASYVFTD